MTPVGLAATAGTSAVSAGLAAIAATVFGIRWMQGPFPLAGGPAGPTVAAVGLPFYLLVFGTLAGILIAGIVAWWLLAPIGSTYRRGGLAMVAAFATVMSMLICMPVDRLFHLPGLAMLAGICLVVSALLARRAHRAPLELPI